ncbi:MAG: hypothetical protein JKY81_00145 [Colwellia sp.]|nr:hypothetical protein [Colwellia sp.]
MKANAEPIALPNPSLTNALNWAFYYLTYQILMRIVYGYQSEDIRMFLPEYNSTQLQRDAKVVFDAASKEPIIITRQCSDGTVMMSKKEYAKLVKAAEK